MKSPRALFGSGWQTVFLAISLLLINAAPAQTTSGPATFIEFLAALQMDSEDATLQLLEQNTNWAKTTAHHHPLLEAAAWGRAKVIHRLLTLGADVNVQGDTTMSGGCQFTALHLAIMKNHLEVCRMLLEAGADPNRMAFGFETPLHLAFKENKEDFANLLLDYGALPFQGKRYVGDETTPFEVAIASSFGRLVPRMLGQDADHPLGAKARGISRPAAKPNAGIKSSAEVLERRGMELVGLAAQRGELEAVVALFRAGVQFKEAATNCPTILQAFALAALGTNRALPDVERRLHECRDRLKDVRLSQADLSYVYSLGWEEAYLSNRVDMMAPERWRKTLEVLIDRGANYDAFAATAMGDIKRAEELMSKTVNLIEVRDCKSETLLHWAVRTAQAPMFDLWLRAGARVDAVNAKGQSALHLAAASGNANFVKSLLSSQASTGIRDLEGLTPLDAAIQHKHAGCIHLLLAAGTTQAHPERGKSTALHKAAAEGDLASLGTLLGTEKNLEPKNELGLTPLQVAVKKGHLAAAALLLDKGADVNARDPEGNSLFHHILMERIVIRDRPPAEWLKKAKANGRGESHLQYLDVAKDEQGPNPVLQAASFLLASGADASVRNKAGQSPMDVISDEKTQFNIFLFEDDRDKLLQLMKAGGSNLDERDASGNTALHRLCTGFYDVHKVEQMASLIANGADVNATNSLGQTPLHLASERIGGWDGNDPPVNEPFQLLVYKKANVNARDNEGRTPLHVVLTDDCSFKQEAIRLLISAGADPNLPDRSGARPLHLVRGSGISARDIQSLLDAGADPNARDIQGRTPAHLCLTGSWPWRSAEECLKKLASVKADFSITDVQGKTPLHYLAALGSHRPLSSIRGIDQILIDAKVDLQAKDKEGNTPALIAAKTGTKDVLEWLIKQGVDLHIANAKGETATSLMKK